jgi:hypothetical protein
MLENASNAGLAAMCSPGSVAILARDIMVPGDDDEEDELESDRSHVRSEEYRFEKIKRIHCSNGGGSVKGKEQGADVFYDGIDLASLLRTGTLAFLQQNQLPFLQISRIRSLSFFN